MLRSLPLAVLLCGCAGASPDGAIEPDDGEMILFGSEPDPEEDAGPPDAGVPPVEPGPSPAAEPDRETETPAPSTPPPAPPVPGGTTGHGEPEGPTP